MPNTVLGAGDAKVTSEIWSHLYGVYRAVGERDINQLSHKYITVN